MVDASGVGRVRGLQERAARALPAEQVEQLGSWWLRRTRSPAWWRGTALPHGAATRDELRRLIPAAERFYARHGAATRFQVSPGVCPDELDASLADRGYRWDGPMSLQAAPIANVRADAAADPASVRVAEAPTPAWFEVWYAVHGEGSDPRLEWDMLDRVRQPSAYASVLADDAVVAVGRAVLETGWVGVFGMATRPEARGRGAGRRVLAALADWAAARGAGGMYLQVEGDNDAAVRLYGKAGFTEACRYHYRTASPGFDG